MSGIKNIYLKNRKEVAIINATNRYTVNRDMITYLLLLHTVLFVSFFTYSIAFRGMGDRKTFVKKSFFSLNLNVDASYVASNNKSVKAVQEALKNGLQSSSDDILNRARYRKHLTL